MKKIKHIWKYLTSPSYRYLIDYCTEAENLDRNMKAIEDRLNMNLRLQSQLVQLFYTENSKNQCNHQWFFDGQKNKKTGKEEEIRFCSRCEKIEIL